MKNKTKYLVTGGCGFIGSAFIRQLLSNKHNFVINVDKLSYASNEKAIETDNNENYILIKKNINDEAEIEKILEKYQPEFILNFAAESHVDRSIDSPSEFIKSNILGTFNLLNKSYSYWSKLDNKKKEGFRYLQISTDEVYGSTNDEFFETSPIKPNSPYAASKASADLLVRAWNKTYNLPVLITNCSNNYGKWQYPEKLIPLTIKKCLLEDNIPIFGDGNQERDWIHVNDHIQGIMDVLINGSIGEIYNIASSKNEKNINIVKMICEYMNDLHPRKKGNYHELITFVKDRPGHDFRYSMNIDKISKELNWSPKIDLSDGLKETIEWYLKNKDWLMDPQSISYQGERLGQIK